MNIISEDVSVDAGLILISDQSFYNKYNGKIDDRLSKVYDVKNGKYKVNWSIKNTWRGNVSGSGTLEITTGKMVVSDPCYNIQDRSTNQWDKVLNDTDYFHNPPKGTVVLDKMGGDGRYDVNIRLEESDV